jgi:hypothetical protein
VSPFEARLRRAADFVATDAGAAWAWRAACVLAVPFFYVVGRDQWFNRDDWAFVVTREQLRGTAGWDGWLFDAQDGHWLTVPIVLFKLMLELFGLGSYWPFLLLALASHAGAVVLSRVVCRRVGVSAWTTTLLTVMLLFFGAGWHNITFAIQVCYNLSVVCFLGQLLLADHDGPIDRRDVAGALLGLVGVMTSGFGPIFMAGLAVLFALRRRWVALALGVGPHVLLYLWWTFTWADRGVAEELPADRPQVPAFVVRGISATFEAMVAFPALAGVAVLATVAAMFGGLRWEVRRVTLALAATVIVMFAGIGWERVGFGVATAGSSRYVHVAALVIAPAFGLAVDRARRFGPESLVAVRVVLLAALIVNVGSLRSAGATFGRASRYEQTVFELVAGSDRLATVAPIHIPVPNSPDINVSDLPLLIAEGAVEPRQPVNDAERALLDAALGAGAPAAPMP